MPQIFHPAFNTLSRASLMAAAFLLAGGFWIAGAVVRSPYVTQTDVVREQPVPFSHRLHAGGLGIDCRYCHGTVETSAFAGMPSTQTCMNCHAQILTTAPALEPVRQSARTGRPLRWSRVHDLPRFVAFDHSIHVAKGVGCVTCHGRVDEMPLLRQVNPMFMESCLDCHRDPGRHVRSRAEVFSMEAPRENTPQRDRELRASTDCSACHR